MEGRQVILLPIQDEFAEMILTGRKPFEFRKTIGEEDPRFVLLYVRDKHAAVGAFATGRIFRGDTEEIWSFTNGSGTTRDRFLTYFEGQERGVALEVRRFERFEPTIGDDTLRQVGLDLPPNFNFVYANSRLLARVRERSVILAELDRTMASPRLDLFSKVDLLRFEEKDEADFVRRTTEEIGKWYDGITVQFAESIIKSHQEGRDVHGLLTRRKTIHVFGAGDTRIGFSVATEKRGGSVKFGPTVILPDYQKKGYAGLGRRLLEDYYRTKGFRKAYSTIPDTHTEALKYLLRSGYRVEAHLRAQYAIDHGEFVLGKRLRRVPGVDSNSQASEGAAASPMIVSDPPNAESVNHFLELIMSRFYSELDTEFRQALLESSADAPQDEKPRLSLYACAGNDVVGCCVLVRKRGGAVKLAPLVSIDDPNVQGLLLDGAESKARSEFAARKIYTLVPVAQPSLSYALESREFEIEGIISEPYRAGMDMILFSKFPRREVA